MAMKRFRVKHMTCPETIVECDGFIVSGDTVVFYKDSWLGGSEHEDRTLLGKNFVASFYAPLSVKEF